MKKKFTKTSIFSIVGSLIVVAGGTTLGLWLGRKYFTYDVPNVEINEHDDELYEKYLLLQKTNASMSKLIDEFRPYQLVKLGFMNFEKTPYAQITSTGTVNAAVANQNVSSKYIKTNDGYFSESLSSGLMKIAWRFYQIDDEIKVYRSDNLIDTNSAEWPNEVKETYNSDSFKETWGKNLKLPLIYTLNQLTVDAEDENSTIDDDNIIVNLSLKPELSTVNYGKQMKKTSGLSDVPTFKQVTLKFTLSKNLTIIKNEIYEEYIVQFHVLPVSTTGTITEQYTYLDNISIPSLSEDADYN